MDSEYLESFLSGLFIALIVGAIFGTIALVITWGVKSSDQQTWTRQYNGCYVHKYNHNYFWEHADVHEKTLLCPAGVTVK